MSKTVFTDGDPSLGVLGTIITAAMMNAVNNHRHKGSDTDGDGAIDYAADSGAADAYVVTLAPALSAHVVGMPIRFKATNANTGASTININSLGAIAIKKNVSSALAAGDIAAGQIVTVVYDGTNYQLAGTGQSVDMSQFAKSHLANGYQKLPNGLIIQWGALTGTGADTGTVTFPITFPTAVLGIYPTDYGTSVGSSCAYSVNDAVTTTSQFTWYCGSTGNGGRFNWLAIGY